MLATDMTEARTNRIQVDDFDGQVVKQLVRYIHTGAIDDSLATSDLDLLFIAEKYDVEGLKFLALVRLQKSLSIDTVCDLFAFALDITDAVELRDECVEFILHNRKAVREHQSWQSLSESAKDFLISFFMRS